MRGPPVRGNSRLKMFKYCFDVFEGLFELRRVEMRIRSVEALRVCHLLDDRLSGEKYSGGNYSDSRPAQVFFFFFRACGVFFCFANAR